MKEPRSSVEPRGVHLTIAFAREELLDSQVGAAPQGVGRYPTAESQSVHRGAYAVAPVGAALGERASPRAAKGRGATESLTLHSPYGHVFASQAQSIWVRLQ